jgi:hypothetical protein
MSEPYRTYFKRSKYNAKKTKALGRSFDSKFEGSVAVDLENRKSSGEIKDYDCQFKAEMTAYRKDGTPAFTKNHKIDFRIHHWDGSFELLEAKGVETPDYKMRKQMLLELWIPEHPDHYYTVVKQNTFRRQVK